MVSSKETILVKVMKSLWYTVVLWLVIVFSSVILMGIEGNHQQLVQWRNMEELEQFNKSLYQVTVTMPTVTMPTVTMYSISTMTIITLLFIRKISSLLSLNYVKIMTLHDVSWSIII